jgi:Cu+-exporting ATPase
MSIMVGTGRGARSGVLVKNAEALERLERVDTLVVDKTGTLTEGKPTLACIKALGFSSNEQVLATAAGLEQMSEHPLAAAIVDAARIQDVRPISFTGFESITGKGVTGDGVAVGNQALMDDLKVSTAAALESSSDMQREG